MAAKAVCGSKPEWLNQKSTQKRPRCCGAFLYSGGWVRRIEQAMQMHDHIPHFRIINGALRVGPPHIFRLFVVWKDANEIQSAKISKF